MKAILFDGEAINRSFPLKLLRCLSVFIISNNVCLKNQQKSK